MSNEKFIAAPQSVPRKRLNADGVYIWAETPPVEAMTVTINPTAHDQLSKSVLSLLSQEHMAPNILFSVLPDANIDQRIILTSKSMNRSLPTRYGKFWYHGILGGSLVGKGVFLSGNMAYMNDGLIFSRTKTPGVFEESGSNLEFTVGNMLLANKFRGAYPAASVTFDPVILRDWLCEKNWIRRSMIQRVFEQLKSKNETPSYLLRIIDTVESIYPFYGGDFSLKRATAEIARGNRLMREELENPQSLASGYLDLMGENRDQVFEALERIGNRSFIEKEHLRVYTQFLCALIATNAVAVERTNQLLFDKGSEYAIVPECASRNKDVGFSFISRDVEEFARERVLLPRTVLDEYVISATDTLHTLLFTYSNVFHFQEPREQLYYAWLIRDAIYSYIQELT